jgi:hypothetical protein
LEKIIGFIFKGQNVEEESQKREDFTSVSLSLSLSLSLNTKNSLNFSAYFINGFCIIFKIRNGMTENRSLFQDKLNRRSPSCRLTMGIGSF